MKKLLILLLAVAGCSFPERDNKDIISLAGEWKFRIDSLDIGISHNWYAGEFEETVNLPGSMAENGKGEDVTINTGWTGDIIDRSYFTLEKYAKYRQPGNIKIPFWLKPVKYYKGAAWYQKDVEIPSEWASGRIVLFLERCHWESSVYINDRKAGTRNSLATPHEYDLTGLMMPGRNRISIRIDNRIIIPVGVNSHSISDHTQSNWNGITGRISLRSEPDVFIDNVKIIPDIKGMSARVIVSIKNPGNLNFKGRLSLHCEGINTTGKRKLARETIKIITKADEFQAVTTYKIPDAELWSEFNPALYKMNVSLLDGIKTIDKRQVDFGMREFKANVTRFEVNGIPVFLRGTLECCIFPLTGYPPTDVQSWEKLLRTCKEYGLNHIRFHSWCPPEAAFSAADKLGVYFQVECSSWANQGSTIGDGSPLDRYIYDEGSRIIKEYGNHPSFCMLAYGNEPAGKNQNKYFGDLLKYWKSIDNRRVYTSGAGHPLIPENDFHNTPAPRIQAWGQGMKSIINAKPPQTMFDYSDIISRYSIPVVSHEIGQWCAYPDFKEITKYTGVLKPTNLEIFRETLAENNMEGQAEDFLKASGKLQTLCYKADIEAALRTPGFAGFQLLQLHDFPGQGTALVGILNPFFESKGYVTPEEFRMFCSETVPLARIEKMTYLNTETFKADIEIAHFGPKPLVKKEIDCYVTTTEGDTVKKEVFRMDEIQIGNCIQAGSLSADLADIEGAGKLTLTVSVRGTSFKNKWDFWVYPVSDVKAPGKVYITEKSDRNAENVLKKGGSVLLLTYGKVGKTKGAQVAIGFSSIFWNTAWTRNQPPHTLGILCDPEHPFFGDFPTEYHSNWQWWDPVTHSQAMILDGFPSDLKPLVQPVDTWFENRKLALAFESKVGNGKIIVCSINLKDSLEKRPVARQLLQSVLKYMNSDSFDPQIVTELASIRSLIN